MLPLESVLNLLTHIHPEVVQVVLANNHLAPCLHSKFLDTKTSLKHHLLSNLPMMLLQYQSVLMLPTGLHTLEVFSPIVPHQLIMPYSLLDIPVTLIG